MLGKKDARLKRARRSRKHMRELGVPRLCVFRTPRHMYAQIISSAGNEILAAASTLDKEVTGDAKGNVEGAGQVGKLIAERAVAKGLSKVAFDRSGFKYHGRVKALADAAREVGLQF